MTKPSSIGGYRSFDLKAITATCLYVATRLGDYIDDTVVVGGLVPSLLINQKSLSVDLDVHAGTMDLDLGLSLAILDVERYTDFASRIIEAGFEPDVNELGNPTNQRWVTKFKPRVTIDFLIPPSNPRQFGGTLLHIYPGFAPVVVDCLDLAFEDRRKVRLSGLTPFGEKATRDVWICGAGAFTVLKALAFGNRGDTKDAYDLAYVWRHLGVDIVAEFLKPRLRNKCVNSALNTIRKDFATFDCIGPRRAAEFLYGRPDDETQADVVGMAIRLLDLLGMEPD